MEVEFEQDVKEFYEGIISEEAAQIEQDIKDFEEKQKKESSGKTQTVLASSNSASFHSLPKGNVVCSEPQQSSSQTIKSPR
jgi:hypothetical protein